MLKSIATVSLSGTLPEKLEAAAAIGFDGVEIFKTDLLTFEGLPEDIRDLANGLGLTITCFQPFRDFEAMPEPQRSRNLDRAERKFDVMQALGTDLLLVCSNVHAAAIDDDARAAADFHALAERAQKRGLRIGYEALAWGRHVNRWRHAYKIVQTANHPNLGPLWGAIAFILLEDRLSAITESWWLMFAPIVIIFALASPEGIQGLVFRLRGRDDWTLTRSGIPPRPATIAPFHGSSQKLDPSKPMLSVTGLHKRFGSLVVATDISLEVYPYKLHSFIGPNGAGKTTFFNMMTGILQPNAGKIVFDGHDITNMPVHKRIRLGVSRSFQILSVFPMLTAFENVRVAVQAQDPRSRGLWKDAYDYEDLNARTWSLLAAVGLEDRAADSCANLGHGQRRLLEIAISLATDAKLLLLDEPLAGLAEADRQVVGALIRLLAETHAVLSIEHDIDRVLALSDRITVLHQGRLIADGSPNEVASNPDVISAYLGAERIVPPPAPSDADIRTHAAAKPILTVDKLRAGYAGSVVLEDISIVVHEGEAVALLGRNGVGKTT